MKIFEFLDRETKKFLSNPKYLAVKIQSSCFSDIFHLLDLKGFFNDNDHNLISLKLGELDKPRKMINLSSIFSIIVIFTSFFVMGCSDNSHTYRTPALFETKAEAEKATKDFNCTGAHKMGNKWMPCKSHADHEDTEKHDSHNDHHH